MSLKSYTFGPPIYYLPMWPNTTKYTTYLSGLNVMLMCEEWSQVSTVNHQARTNTAVCSAVRTYPHLILYVTVRFIYLRALSDLLCLIQFQFLTLKT